MPGGDPGGTGLLAQFRQPHGRLGPLVGVLLTIANAALNRHAVARLAPVDGERVLEIGFGPGLALRELSDRLPHGRVAGIDPSDVMLRQASRRNRAALAAGRLELRPGTAAQLPWRDATFDAVLSVNNVLLWEPFDASLGEVARVLRPGGRFVLALNAAAARVESRPRAGSLAEVAVRLGAALTRAGFAAGPGEIGRAGLGTALCLVARRTAPAPSASAQSGGMGG